MKMLRSVKGMHDIVDDEIAGWHKVEDAYRQHVERYGYREVRTPVLEPLELFVRGIGEATDIVEKEMYSFEDKGGDFLALRPEGTASAIRAYVQHSIAAKEGQTKWYYIAPMFRRERPAKGRYRQFHQAGAELIGVAEPTADAEIIDMAVSYMSHLGLKGIGVKLNTLGGPESRGRFREALVSFFQGRSDRLCTDCQRRLSTNPLRILDCKAPTCIEVAQGAPGGHELLSQDDRTHFDSLRRLLDRWGTPYEVAPSMVRGLDYYTRTIFEVQVDSEALGTKGAILGGGRYDNLVAELGGKPTPTIGYAFGIERLLLVLGEAAVPPQTHLIFVTGVGDGGAQRAFDVARSLRGNGLRAEVAYVEGSLRSQLKRADKFGATFVVIAGAEEAARGCVMLRDMSTGEQEEVSMDGLAARLRESQ
ncbi:MAG: histidine--tRNA ligase [Myxococcota bacterium]|jgi:histidyl-tRNA synthetase|nr:histidine--tRNA ligase [Myxococcota bacterium]